MQLFINRESHHQKLSQTGPSRHTVLWAANCKVVTEVGAGAFGDCWEGIFGTKTATVLAMKTLICSRR